MVEKLYTGRVTIDNFPKLITSCHFPQDALVLAEQLPDYVIDDTNKPQDLLRFTYFEPDKSEQVNLLANYTSGRIFQENAELRWEKQGDMMRIVYLGSEEYVSALHDYGLQENMELYKLVSQQAPKYYYLFGERLKTDDLKKMGGIAKPGDFAQVRIPHLLHYPVSQSSGRYVRLGVREYIDTITGQTMLFRFQSLKAVGDV
jgi:hypothetical protein